MNFGIAVDLARRGLQDPGGFLPRELEEVTGAKHACLHRAERITLIIARGGSAGEIVDPMYRRCDRQWLADVMFDEAEVSMIHQRADIGEPTGIEIVDAEDAPPLLQKPVTQMRSDEAGASSDERRPEIVVSSRALGLELGGK